MSVREHRTRKDWAEAVARLLDKDFPEAEIELSVLTKMCLNRRIADMTTYRYEVQAWQEERNRLGGSILCFCH